MRHYLTYTDRNYLIRAVALARSIATHDISEHELIVVCLDQITEMVLGELALPNVQTMPLHELEHRDLELLATRAARSKTEYYWTLTPTIMRHVLSRRPEIEVLVYSDADALFFADCRPLFDELGAGSVLIHEHRFHPSLAGLAKRSGIYNVGLMCFRRDGKTRTILDHWREQCLKWCYARFEDDKFGDQKYLDDWAQRHPAVKVLHNTGAGSAPWNHGNHSFSTVNGVPLIDNQRLIHYHFHGLEICSPHQLVPFRHNYALSGDVMAHVYTPYANCLAEAIEILQQKVGFFAGGQSFDLEKLDGERHILVKRGDGKNWEIRTTGTK